MTRRNPNRQGRDTAVGLSPRLGARDPRVRMGMSQGVTENDLKKGSLALEKGRIRIAAVDDVAELPSTATLADVISTVNQLTRGLKV